MSMEYCLGLGASSKANNEGAAQDLIAVLHAQNILVQNIATLDKFEHSIWLAVLKVAFHPRVFLFSYDELSKFQTKIISPSAFVFDKTGFYGVAEAAALAALGNKAELIITKKILNGFTYAVAHTST